MREIKAVSFNVKDSYEMKLFKHSNEQGSFSKYVKRLIGFHMENVPKTEIPFKTTSSIQTDYNSFEDE